MRNVGAKAGDVLVLTKPLGLGILTTALKRHRLGGRDRRRRTDGLPPQQGRQRRDARGRRLCGHRRNGLRLSRPPDGDAGERRRAAVHRDEIPVWERAVPLANDGVYPGGLKSNRKYLEDRVTADGVDQDDLLPLYDRRRAEGCSSLCLGLGPPRWSARSTAWRNGCRRRRGGRRRRGASDCLERRRWSRPHSGV